MVLHYLFYKLYVGFLFGDFALLTAGVPYQEWSILLYGMNTVGVFWVVVVSVLVFILVFCAIKWSDFDWWQWRYLIGFYTLCLSWAFSTYGYNYFFNQGHYLDRLLVLAVGIATLLTPAFLFLAVPFSLVLASQMDYEIFVLNPIEEHLLLSVLLYFMAVLVVKSLLDLSDGLTVLGLFVVVGTNYFGPGLWKTILADDPVLWVTGYELIYDFGWKNFLGWFRNLPEWGIEVIFWTLETFNEVFLGLILLVEIGVFFLFASRRVSFCFLVLFLCFHLGFFLLVGVLFTKWLLVIAGLLCFFVVLDDEILSGIYRKYASIFCFWLLVATLTGLVPYKDVSWGGTKYNIDYELIAVNEDGRRFSLSEQSFPPYTRFFSQSYMRLHFLLKDRKILGPSYNDYSTAITLNQLLSDVDDVEPVRNKLGFTPYDREGALFFDRFVRTYVRNFYNNRKYRPFRLFQYGGRYYSKSRGKDLTLDEIPGRVKKVKVLFEESYFTGSEHIPLDEKIIRTIDID